MEIDIQLVPLLPQSAALSSRTVVVIDVLRSTSVMVHALSQGASEIIPTVSVEEALKISEAYSKHYSILAGEKENKKIPGFDLGNSPPEYAAQTVKGRRIILTTTNGTKAFHTVSSGKDVFAGSFLNIGALSRQCLELKRDLLIFPSGDEGKFSLEDTLCGGMLIDRIIKKGTEPVSLTDASLCTMALYQRFKDNLVEAFHLSHHGKELVKRGFEQDLIYCAQIDLFDIVPKFKSGIIRVS